MEHLNMLDSLWGIFKIEFEKIKSDQRIGSGSFPPQGLWCLSELIGTPTDLIYLDLLRCSCSLNLSRTFGGKFFDPLEWSDLILFWK